MTDAEQLRAKLEFETDAPVPTTFRRDTHLTPQALLKAKVLAVLKREMECYREESSPFCALEDVAELIEAIAP